MENKSRDTEVKLPGPIETLINSLYCVGEEVIKRGQVSIEVFVRKISGELDAYVIKEEASNAISLVSGEVFLCVSEDDSSCHIEVELYFKNQEGKWIKKSIKTDPIPLSWSLIPTEQERLKQVRKIKFPYEHP